MLRSSILAVLVAAAVAQSAWPVRGNTKSQIYFWPGCYDYQAIAERHRMDFPSACAAEAAGFHAARNCHHREIPPGHRGDCNQKKGGD